MKQTLILKCMSVKAVHAPPRELSPTNIGLSGGESDDEFPISQIVKRRLLRAKVLLGLSKANEGAPLPGGVPTFVANKLNNIPGRSEKFSTASIKGNSSRPEGASLPGEVPTTSQDALCEFDLVKILAESLRSLGMLDRVRVLRLISDSVIVVPLDGDQSTAARFCLPEALHKASTSTRPLGTKQQLWVDEHKAALPAQVALRTTTSHQGITEPGLIAPAIACTPLPPQIPGKRTRVTAVTREQRDKVAADYSEAMKQIRSYRSRVVKGESMRNITGLLNDRALFAGIPYRVNDVVCFYTGVVLEEGREKMSKSNFMMSADGVTIDGDQVFRDYGQVQLNGIAPENPGPAINSANHEKDCNARIVPFTLTQAANPAILVSQPYGGWDEVLTWYGSSYRGVPLQEAFIVNGDFPRALVYTALEQLTRKRKDSLKIRANAMYLSQYGVSPHTAGMKAQILEQLIKDIRAAEPPVLVNAEGRIIVDSSATSNDLPARKLEVEVISAALASGVPTYPCFSSFFRHQNRYHLWRDLMSSHNSDAIIVSSALDLHHRGRHNLLWGCERASVMTPLFSQSLLQDLHEYVSIASPDQFKCFTLILLVPLMLRDDIDTIISTGHLNDSLKARFWAACNFLIPVRRIDDRSLVQLLEWLIRRYGTLISVRIILFHINGSYLCFEFPSNIPSPSNALKLSISVSIRNGEVYLTDPQEVLHADALMVSDPTLATHNFTGQLIHVIRGTATGVPPQDTPHPTPLQHPLVVPEPDHVDYIASVSRRFNEAANQVEMEVFAAATADVTISTEPNNIPHSVVLACRIRDMLATSVTGKRLLLLRQQAAEREIDSAQEEIQPSRPVIGADHTCRNMRYLDPASKEETSALLNYLQVSNPDDPAAHCFLRIFIPLVKNQLLDSFDLPFPAEFRKYSGQWLDVESISLSSLLAFLDSKASHSSIDVEMHVVNSDGTRQVRYSRVMEAQATLRFIIKDCNILDYDYALLQHRSFGSSYADPEIHGDAAPTPSAMREVSENSEDSETENSETETTTLDIYLPSPCEVNYLLGNWGIIDSRSMYCYLGVFMAIVAYHSEKASDLTSAQEFRKQHPDLKGHPQLLISDIIARLQASSNNVHVEVIIYIMSPCGKFVTTVTIRPPRTMARLRIVFDNGATTNFSSHLLHGRESRRDYTDMYIHGKGTAAAATTPAASSSSARGSVTSQRAAVSWTVDHGKAVETHNAAANSSISAVGMTASPHSRSASTVDSGGQGKHDSSSQPNEALTQNDQNDDDAADANPPPPPPPALTKKKVTRARTPPAAPDIPYVDAFTNLFRNNSISALPDKSKSTVAPPALAEKSISGDSIASLVTVSSISAASNDGFLSAANLKAITSQPPPSPPNDWLRRSHLNGSHRPT